MIDMSVLQRIATLEANQNGLKPHEHARSDVFTPTYFGATTAGVTTYAASGQLATYTLQGSICFFSLYLLWTNATGTGNALIGGLPFTSRATNPPFAVPALLYNNITYAAGTGIQMLIRNGTSQIEIYNSPASNVNVAAIAVEAAGEFLLSGFYHVQ